jgi:Domain of unknown function (DUF4157)
MEHEFAEQLRAREKSRRPADPEQDSLPSTIGNRAFTDFATGSVQRSALPNQGAGPLDEEIAGAIDERRGSGAPLEDGVRSEMETHIGADLSEVRVHNDSSAHDLNRSVSAEAFTAGSDLFFKQGKYSPGTDSGKKLLAHELTHVVQQRVTPPTESQVSDPGDPQEVEARKVADSFGSNTSTHSDASEGLSRAAESEDVQLSVDRQEEEEELMMSVDRQEEEEELMMSVDRQEEEEELMMSVDRQEEEEELMMSVDRDRSSRR